MEERTDFEEHWTASVEARPRDALAIVCIRMRMCDGVKLRKSFLDLSHERLLCFAADDLRANAGGAGNAASLSYPRGRLHVLHFECLEWAAAGFKDTEFRCDDETGGAPWRGSVLRIEQAWSAAKCAPRSVLRAGRHHDPLACLFDSLL